VSTILMETAPETFQYDHWRHGGWYWFADGTHWPNGGCGCVSRQLLNPETHRADRKWRIVCDPRSKDYTYPSRDAAAQAEWALMRKAHLAVEAAQAAIGRGEDALEVVRIYNHATPYRP
jgi:hypothetical protein